MIKCSFLFFVVIFGSEIPDEKNLALKQTAYLANTNLTFTNATNNGCDKLKGVKKQVLYYIDLHKIRHIKELQFEIHANSDQPFNVRSHNDNSDFENWFLIKEDLMTGSRHTLPLDSHFRYVGFEMNGMNESVRICYVSIAGVSEELTNIKSSWFEWTKNEDTFEVIRDFNATTCAFSHNAEAHHLHLYVPEADKVGRVHVFADCLTGVEDCDAVYDTSKTSQFRKELCGGTNQCFIPNATNIIVRSEQKNKHVLKLCKMAFTETGTGGYYKYTRWVQNHNTSLLFDNNTQSCLVTPWLFVNGAQIVLPLLRRLNFVKIYAICKIEQEDCEYKVLIGDKSFDCKRGWCEHTFTPILAKSILISFVEKTEVKVCEVSLVEDSKRKKSDQEIHMIIFIIAVVCTTITVLIVLCTRTILKSRSSSSLQIDYRKDLEKNVRRLTTQQNLTNKASYKTKNTKMKK